MYKCLAIQYTENIPLSINKRGSNTVLRFSLISILLIGYILVISKKKCSAFYVYSSMALDDSYSVIIDILTAML